MGNFGKKISLREASAITGYHPDYLSSLIRNKQLEGKKIGRNWYTTKEALKDYKFVKDPNFKFFITKKRMLGVFVVSIIVIALGAYVLINSKSEVEKLDSDSKKLDSEIEVVSFVNVRSDR